MKEDQPDKGGTLEDRVTKLETMLEEVAKGYSIDTTLGNGLNKISKRLKTITAQLQPLRELAPTRTLLNPNQLQQIQNLRTALLRPEWSGVTSLPVTEKPVSFFGEAPPSAPAKKEGAAS